MTREEEETFVLSPASPFSAISRYRGKFWGKKKFFVRVRTLEKAHSGVLRRAKATLLVVVVVLLLLVRWNGLSGLGTRAATCRHKIDEERRHANADGEREIWLSSIASPGHV